MKERLHNTLRPTRRRLIQRHEVPGMNGHEAAGAIRSIEKEHGLEAARRARIVMLTALNSPQDVMESFYSAQSAAYLVKPVSKEKLSGVIAKLGLNRKR